MAGRRLLPRAPLESPNPSGSWEEGESEGEEGVARPGKDSPHLGWYLGALGRSQVALGRIWVSINDFGMLFDAPGELLGALGRLLVDFKIDF